MAKIHHHSTEGLIVISQTVFFIVLFIIIKSWLLDNFGVMHSVESLKQNAVQIGAIYFAILVFISVIMFPLYHYDYAAMVILGYGIGVVVVIFRDIQRVIRRDESSENPKSSPTLPITKPKKQTPSSAKKAKSTGNSIEF